MADSSWLTPAQQTILGTGLKAGGQYADGMSASGAASYDASAIRANGAFTSAQLRVNAGQAVAGSQRDMATEAFNSKVVQSRALALSAASGGSATDPTVLAIMGGLAGKGTYNEQMAQYNGSERARSMYDQANANDFQTATNAAMQEYNGKVANAKAIGGMVSTVLSGSSSLKGNTVAPASTAGGMSSTGATDYTSASTWAN